VHPVRLSLFLALFLLPGTALAGSADPCAGRERCSVVQVHDAGTDSRGNRLAVVEAWIANPPEADADNQCRDGADPPGGQEYWLKTTTPTGAVTLAERPLRALCDTGRPGAGIGGHMVEIQSNRLNHKEMGGTSHRWELDRSYRLSPFQPLAWGECFHRHMDVGASSLVATVEPLEIRFWDEPEDEPEDGNDLVGCPNRYGKPHTLLGLPIVSLRTEVAAGTVIGTCGTEITADKGFAARGASGGSSFKAVLVEDGSLLVQVSRSGSDGRGRNVQGRRRPPGGLDPYRKDHPDRSEPAGRGCAHQLRKPHPAKGQPLGCP